MNFTWTKFRRAETVKTIGHEVVVDLPLLGIESLKAKVDTGAYSGALHATHIREIEDDEHNSRLQFMPLGSKDHLIEVDTYHKRQIKSSNGQIALRYAIDTELRLEGQTFPITVTLADRRAMKYEMLIGRNFLRVHGFLIDLANGKS